MAVTKFKKASLVVLGEKEEAVVSVLQDLACCEIMPEPTDTRTHDWAKCIKSADEALADIRSALRFLEPYYPEVSGKLERLLGEKPTVTVEELENLSNSIDLASLSSSVKKIERRMLDIRTLLSKLDSNEEILIKLRQFPYSLAIISSGTVRISSIVGTLPVAYLERFQGLVAELLASDGELFVAPFTPKETDVTVVLMYDKKKADEVAEICEKVPFTKLDFPPELEGTPEEELSKIERNRTELAKESENLERNAAKLASEWVPTLRNLLDYYSVIRTRYETLVNASRTEKVSVIKFWVPEPAVGKLKEKLSKFGEELELIIEDPSDDDEPPTLLENPRWALPFEPLTRLYGAPKYGEIDPTVPMAPFMFLFFGMCLGDGGYGVLIAFAITYLLSKYKIVGDTKNFLHLLLLGALSTIAVGALTGSWMGDMIDAFPFLALLKPLKDRLVVLNPMSDPITFLGISLALGVVQILFGLSIAFWDSLRKKDYMAAFGDNGGWISLLIGLLLLGGVKSGFLGGAAGLLGKILSILGAAVLVATQGREKTGLFRRLLSGVLSLYNITSYLGDILSYSRLLALGLATSAIAMIVNTLTNLVLSIPFVGWILSIVIFVGGHLFSVVVNTLGAFIHSLRLQYVEFFSKFYSGGGRIFQPLEYRTRYVKIVGSKPLGQQSK
ncbi:V-type ATP synthase subunit I [Thermovirga lienii]|uniref:V-type ATP synthase subunit I n=1 Tax=Thermovirga lienii TaxID=336261 RepID=UPI000EE4A7B2|nr:V-type ATP synthase subunit I [Thermovirga lienii]